MPRDSSSALVTVATLPRLESPSRRHRTSPPRTYGDQGDGGDDPGRDEPGKNPHSAIGAISPMKTPKPSYQLHANADAERERDLRGWVGERAIPAGAHRRRLVAVTPASRPPVRAARAPGAPARPVRAEHRASTGPDATAPPRRTIRRAVWPVASSSWACTLGDRAAASASCFLRLGDLLGDRGSRGLVMPPRSPATPTVTPSPMVATTVRWECPGCRAARSARLSGVATRSAPSARRTYSRPRLGRNDVHVPLEDAVARPRCRSGRGSRGCAAP